MKTANKGVNLLSPAIKPAGRWDKIYNWTTNTAKYIIIVMELVVIGAIAVRLYFDGRIALIKEELDTQQDMVTARKSDEVKTRQLITGLQQIDELEANQISLGLQYKKVYDLVPPSLSIKNISIDLSNCSINGTAQDYSTLLKLENNLKNAEFLKDVIFSTNQSASSTVTFTASFKLLLPE